MAEWMDGWIDGKSDEWMDGWTDCLGSWTVGQLDEPMHEIFSNFRSHNREKSRRKSITKMGTDTCSCRRCRRRVFGPVRSGPAEESLSTQFPAFRI